MHLIVLLRERLSDAITTSGRCLIREISVIRLVSESRITQISRFLLQNHGLRRFHGRRGEDRYI